MNTLFDPNPPSADNSGSQPPPTAPPVPAGGAPPPAAQVVVEGGDEPNLAEELERERQARLEAERRAAEAEDRETQLRNAHRNPPPARPAPADDRSDMEKWFAGEDL